MRKLILPLVFSALTALPTMAVQANFEIKDETGKKDIKIEGETEDDRQKSLMFPFGAYQIGHQEVCITSYDNCTSVTISIIDVYGNTMDTQSLSLAPLQIVSLDISNYPHGTYTLVISTPQGTYLTGVFEVE